MILLSFGILARLATLIVVPLSAAIIVRIIIHYFGI